MSWSYLPVAGSLWLLLVAALASTVRDRLPAIAAVVRAGPARFGVSGIDR